MAAATIAIQSDREVGRIDPKIYGHFLESNFFWRGRRAGGGRHPVAAGAVDASLMETAGHLFDYVSLHLHGASTHLYTAASGDNDDDAVVNQPLFLSERIEHHSEMVAELARDACVDRQLSLALDEWNVRHLEPRAWADPLPGSDGGTAARDEPPAAIAGRADLRVVLEDPEQVATALELLRP